MTPRQSDTNGSGLHGEGGMDLRTQTELWATPTRDHKDGSDPSDAVATNSLLGRQAPRMMRAGEPSSPSAPTSRLRLNPRFSAWLMGWPMGWLDLTNSPSSATASCRCAPPSPSPCSPSDSATATRAWIDQQRAALRRLLA